MPTLADLRTRLPALDGLDDENALAFIQERYYPDQPIAKIADALGYKPPPAPTPPASLMDRVKDTGIGLMQGGVQAAQGVAGLADLVSGGAAGKALEDNGVDFNSANQYWNDKLSPAQQAVNAKVQQSFQPQEGDNFASPYLRGAATAITNPSSIWQTVLQSAPSMAVGGAIGRGAMWAALSATERAGVMALAPELRAGAIQALAPKMANVASGIGETTITAGQQAEQIRTDELNPGHEMTGTQSLLAGGSGAVTGTIAAVISSLARKYGFETAHNLVAGIHADPVGTVGKIKAFLGGGLSEGTQEFLQSAQEQMAQNVAVGADPWKDVPQNAVMGALAGLTQGIGANMVPNARRHAAPDPEDAIDPNTPPEAKAARASALAEIGAAGSVDEAVDAFKRTQLPLALGRGTTVDGDAAMKRLAETSAELTAPAAQPTMDPETGQLVPPPPFGERLEGLRAQLEDSRVKQQIRETAGPEALNDILHFAAAADNPNLPGQTSDAMLARAEAILAQAQQTPVPGGSTPSATTPMPGNAAAPTLPVASTTPGNVSTASAGNGTSPVSTPIAPTVPRQGAFDSEAAVREYLRTSQRPLAGDRQSPAVPEQHPDGSWGYTTDKTAVEADKTRSLKDRAASMARGEKQPEPAPRGTEQLPEPMEGKNGMKAVFSHSTSNPGQIHVTLFDGDSGNAVGTKIVGSLARAKFEAEKLLGIRKPEEKFFEPRANLARAGVELAPAPAPAERRQKAGSIFDRLAAEGDAQKKRLGDADLERAQHGESNATGQERKQSERQPEHRDGDRSGQTPEAGGGDRAVDHGQSEGEGAGGAKTEAQGVSHTGADGETIRRKMAEHDEAAAAKKADAESPYAPGIDQAERDRRMAVRTDALQAKLNAGKFADDAEDEEAAQNGGWSDSHAPYEGKGDPAYRRYLIQTDKGAVQANFNLSGTFLMGALHGPSISETGFLSLWSSGAKLDQVKARPYEYAKFAIEQRQAEQEAETLKQSRKRKPKAEAAPKPSLKERADSMKALRSERELFKREKAAGQVPADQEFSGSNYTGPNANGPVTPDAIKARPGVQRIESDGALSEPPDTPERKALKKLAKSAPDSYLREQIPKVLAMFDGKMSIERLTGNLGDPNRTGYLMDETLALRAIKALVADGTLRKVGNSSVELVKAEPVKEIVQRDTRKAVAKAKQRMALDPENDTMLQALAKLGGIKREVVEREYGMKGEELRHTVPVGGLKGFPFRASGGMDLDRAIEALTEAGYFRGVPEEDVPKRFEEAIFEEIGGSPTYTAEGDMRRAAQSEAERQQEQAEHEQMLEQPAISADERAELDQLTSEAGISTDDLAELSDDQLDVLKTVGDKAAILKALGITDDETQSAEGAQHPADAGPAPTGEAPQDRHAGSGDEGSAFALTQPTPADLAAAAKDRATAESRDSADQRRLAEKAKADAERGEFTLTGSDRPADVAAAGGQKGMFDEPAPADGVLPASDVRGLSEADAIRKLRGWTQASVDAYDPEQAVRSFGKGANRWFYESIEEGGSGRVAGGLYATKREALEAAKRHKAQRQDMVDNPTGYANVTSELARARLERIAFHETAGMSEMQAGKLARKEVPDWEPSATAAPSTSVLAMTSREIAALAGRSIEIPLQVGDGGKTATMTMDAAEAVRDVQKRNFAATELLRCLS